MLRLMTGDERQVTPHNLMSPTVRHGDRDRPIEQPSAALQQCEYDNIDNVIIVDSVVELLCRMKENMNQVFNVFVSL